LDEYTGDNWPEGSAGIQATKHNTVHIATLVKRWRRD
jgi:hypothetical protein